MPRLTREPLTLKTTSSAKATGRLYRLRDSTVPGLALRVAATGKKSWAVTWGRGQERIIGVYPVMTLDAAREAARRELGEVASHGAPLATIEANKPASERPLTFGEFVADHYQPWALAHQKQGKATIAAISACFGFLGEKLLTEISAFDIERFKSKRLKAGLKVATVNRDLDRIRGALSRAVDLGMLGVHPLKAVKRAKGDDNTRVRYLAKDEEKRLRKALIDRERSRRLQRRSGNLWERERGHEERPEWPEGAYTDHLMPIVLLALNTGLRRGELFGLDWRSVNLSARLLTVTAGTAKARRARHLPLNVEALDVLTQWREQGDGNGLVFSGVGGGRLTNINKSWEGLVTAAKVSDFRFHDLRHDFASKLVMAGVDLNTVRELMGHADIKMTLRYAHLAPDKLADAVAKLR